MWLLFLLLGAAMRRATALCNFPSTSSSTTKSWSSQRSETGTSESSEFADFLLATLGKGATSVSGLQTAAMAMVRESGGHCSQLTKKLARIGGAGAFPQNAERDLFRILELPIEPVFITVPIRDRSRPGRRCTTTLRVRLTLLQ
ncbi:unnamed protein product [Durusdinium trenchii]|uniref:Secreted protein n=1 Tax=Durusdinium trenchii TaxID=1381693 RepID=A0ABP0R7P4_9DINO